MNYATGEPVRSSDLVTVAELVLGGGFRVVFWYLKGTTSKDGRRVSLLNNPSPRNLLNNITLS
jgi:hypothetical protein